MNSNLVATQLLVVALALVMFGLGLSLSVQDFTRLLKHPKAVVVALVLQVVLLPLACYLLIVAFFGRLALNLLRRPALPCPPATGNSPNIWFWAVIGLQIYPQAISPWVFEPAQTVAFFVRCKVAFAPLRAHSEFKRVSRRRSPGRAGGFFNQFHFFGKGVSL